MKYTYIVLAILAMSAQIAHSTGSVTHVLVTKENGVPSFSQAPSQIIKQADSEIEILEIKTDASTIDLTATEASNTAESDSAGTVKEGSGSAGSGSAGSGSAGSGSAGSGSAGSGSAGSGSAGSGSAGSGSAGSDTAGSDTAGSDTAGSDAAGTDTASSGSAGTDKASSNSAASVDTVSGNTVSGNTVSGNTVSGNTVSGNTVSGNTGSRTVRRINIEDTPNAVQAQSIDVLAHDQAPVVQAPPVQAPVVHAPVVHASPHVGQIVSNCQKVKEIGINLGSINYFAGEVPLKDLAKTASGWNPRDTLLNGLPLDLDSNGYMNTVSGMGVRTIITNDNWGRSESDRNYVLLYDGEGELEFSLNKPDIIKKEQGRIEIVLNKGRLGLNQLSSNPTNHLRNIRIVPLKNEYDYEQNIVRDSFKQLWNGVGVIRYLNPQTTNNSKEVRWQDRKQPNSLNGQGMSLEDIIQMSNETNTYPWIHAPHQANDQYFKEMARYVKAHLNSNLKVYIEYSNEVWNNGFYQTGYIRRLGERNDTSTQYEYGTRAKQLFDIWTREFGTDSGRVVRVLGTKFYHPWSTKETLKVPGLAESVDAVAVGYYIGSILGSKLGQWAHDSTEQQLFNYLNGKALSDAAVALDGQMDIIKQTNDDKNLNIKLVAYEAGQHLAAGRDGAVDWRKDQELVDKFTRMNLSPKMYDVYINMYKLWKEKGGELIVWFQSAGIPSKYGNWGLLDLNAPNPTLAPKYRAVRKMLSDNGC